MYITKLELINFRNYEHIKLTFNQKENLIVGKNGVGKTNILEAINLISSAKSFKKNDDDIMMKKNEIGFNIKLTYIDEDKENTIEYQYSNKIKRLYLNGNLLKRTSDLLGHLLTNTFIPSDVYLFSKTPEDRRHLIDDVLTKLDNKYLYSLSRYKSILKDRNKILQLDNQDEDVLKVYMMELISNGYAIMNQRRDFVININKNITKFYNMLKSNAEDTAKLKLTYVNKFKLINNYETYLNTLIKAFNDNKSIERIKKTTLFGPHRDDFTLTIDSIPIQDIASQSETKIANLALSLSIVEYIKLKKKKIPIILLDDIFSDLDSIRITNLFNLIHELDQVILTTTTIPNSMLHLNKIDIENLLNIN